MPTVTGYGEATCTVTNSLAATYAIRATGIASIYAEAMMEQIVRATLIATCSASATLTAYRKRTPWQDSDTGLYEGNPISLEVKAFVSGLHASPVLGHSLVSTCTAVATTAARKVATIGTTPQLAEVESFMAPGPRLGPDLFPYGYEWTGEYPGLPPGGPTPGQYIDPSDLNTLVFTVGGVVIDLSSNSKYTLIQLSVTHDAKVLTFREIPDVSYGAGNHLLESYVTLWLNYGTGFRTVFTGWIKLREHSGSNNQEEITYTALGVPQAANEVQLVSPDGFPEIIIYQIPMLDREEVITRSQPSVRQGKIIQVPYTVPHFFYRPMNVKDAVEYLFYLMGPELLAAGISPYYDLSGLLHPVTPIPQELHLQGGFMNALQQLISYAPGTKVIFDDVNQVWRFIPVFFLPNINIRIEENNVLSHRYSSSTEGRFTSILLVERPDNTGRKPLELDIDKHTLHVKDVTFALQPAWEDAYESDWSIENANPRHVQAEIDGRMVDLPDHTDVGYMNVYRVWYLLAPFRPQPGMKTKLLHIIHPYGPTDFQEVDCSVIITPDVTPTWEQQALSLGIFVGSPRAATKYGLVVASQPVVLEGNPHHPGDAVGPGKGEVALAMEYPKITPKLQVKGGDNFNIPHISYLRWPPYGYQGSAYYYAGIARTKYELVGKNEVTVASAIMKLAVLQEINVSGEIPLVGDPIPEFFNLDVSLRLTSIQKSTGLENVPGIITSFRYDFSQTGLNTVAFTTDPSQFIREVQK